MSEQKPTVDDAIRNSGLSENLQAAHIEFCRFLHDNGFLIEPEGHTADNVSGWIIRYGTECVGHTNYAHVGVWIDVCDFGDSTAADEVLKEFTWAHVRVCEHHSSGGKQCGCGRQPGYGQTIFGKRYENLCFALLEFMNPDVKALEEIQKLLLLLKQNSSSHTPSLPPSPPAG